MKWLALPLLAVALAACSTVPGTSPSPLHGGVSRPPPAPSPALAGKDCSRYAPAREDLSTRGDYTAGGLYKPGVSDTTPDHVPDLDCIREPLVTAEPRSCAFSLRQVSRAIWLATMGGKVATLVAAVAGSAGPPVVAAKPAIYRWEPDEGKLPEGAIWVDFDDEKPDGTALRYRFGFRRAAQSEAVEFNLKRTDAVNLPNPSPPARG